MKLFPIVLMAARHIRTRRHLTMLAVFAAMIALAGPLRAGNLYVPNFSFESQVTDFADPRIDSWQKPLQPAGFDTNVFGAWTNLAGMFANPPESPYYIDNADGGQLAFLFAYPQMAILQDFSSTDWSNGAPTHAFNAKFEAGKSYHLTAGFTSSSVEPLTQGSTLQMSLYYRDLSSNMVTVAATNITYDTNVFTNLTHLLSFEVDVPAVKTNDAWAGQNIGIQFMSTASPELIGGVWDMDSVRLTETIGVPNFSFESQVTDFADPRIDSWQKPLQPAGFDTNIFGAWTNLAGMFANPPESPYYVGNADGSQLAFLFAYPQMAIFQDFNSTDWSNGAPTHVFNAKFKIGKSYTLTTGFTSSSVESLTQGSTLQMSLYYRDLSNNMVTVAATNITYDTNVFTNLTQLIDFQASIPMVRATDPWAGQNMGIQFMSTTSPNLIGGVWDLDNVRLTEVVATALDTPSLTNSQFSFTLQSEPGLGVEIQAASILTLPATNWTSLATFTNTTGAFPFTDVPTNLNQRYYRARQL